MASYIQDEAGRTSSDSSTQHRPPQHGRLPSASDIGSFDETLECTVTQPVKEQDGTKDAFVSYLITTKSDFPVFQKQVTTVRRRFTDFVFLFKALTREYPASAIPPIPDKQRLEYVRGDRFGPEFTSRRAKSLERFLSRLCLHPILRRASIFHTFLETTEWNSTMRSLGLRFSTQDQTSGGLLENVTDTLMTAFSKPPKVDESFVTVRERSDRLDDDLAKIEKIVARLLRREGEVETDLSDLATQFQTLQTMEPGVADEVRSFSVSVHDSSRKLRTLHDYTDQEYLGALRDMQAYSFALKGLLKSREQKQGHYEALLMYLARYRSEKMELETTGPSSSTSSAVPSGGGVGGGLGGPSTTTSHTNSLSNSLHLGSATGFIRSRIEDARGIDQEQVRRDRLRKLDLRVDELAESVDKTRNALALFDEEVGREVANFERIKGIELKAHLEGVSSAHIDYYKEVESIWEKYIKDLESQQQQAT